jgi:hypothetical protein
MTQADDEVVNNLKEDFIVFYPKLGGMSNMRCTCGKLDAWDTSHDKLAKAAVKHARKTGHTLNPRGN